MELEKIVQSWKAKVIDPETAVALWDGKAEQFAGKQIPTAENSLAIRLISEQAMIRTGDRVLDIGCGGGRFSFAMEGLGATVLGTDFSPKMIEQCEKTKAELQSTAEFCVCDWNTVNLKKEGWAQAFDLVLANMTPAIGSAETFLKLSEASRNWCLLVKPVKRKNSVHDRLTDLLGLEAENKSLDESLAYAFSILWHQGFRPGVEYEDQIWEKEIPLKAAIADYTLRLRSWYELTEVQEEQITLFLHEIATDNMIRETVHTTIAAIYWKV